MLKNSVKIFGIIFLAYIVSGCAVRTYTQVKDRVDQDTSSGNQGYLYGAPPQEDRSHIRKTRKTYVLEFSTTGGESEAATKSPGRVQVSEESSKPDRSNRGNVYQAPSESPVIAEPTPSSVEYTVEKGDTLQKISKKFYDTYRKWNTIYEANKDTLKDPNSIKPGMVLIIPQ